MAHNVHFLLLIYILLPDPYTCPSVYLHAKLRAITVFCLSMGKGLCKSLYIEVELGGKKKQPLLIIGSTVLFWPWIWRDG